MIVGGLFVCSPSFPLVGANIVRPFGAFLRTVGDDGPYSKGGYHPPDPHPRLLVT